jgi:NAD(P)-dependent dehydrogenase (short-subunit alcohol dehydrogenase family)
MSEQQTILVTGGASGIGLAIAEAALKEGWRTIIADRDAKSLERCREELSQSADRTVFEILDVSDEESVISSIDRYASEFGPIGGLVNCAGIGSDIPALETSAALFRKILEINLIGSFVVAREIARHMQAHGGGSIINISSVSGIRGNSGRVAYGASKGGVINMTKVMAVEWAPKGIRVNAIAPGPIETPLVREMHTPESRAEWMHGVPMDRYGQPAEIAGTAIFLLDGTKSGYITGQTISVDGGFTAAGLRHNAR